MQVEWYKCSGGIWCDLTKLDLEHKYLQGFDGVFILWSGSNPKSVIKIGEGNVPKEFSELKKDLAVMAFSHLGLFVTWAEVPGSKREGVINFLAGELKPKFKVDSKSKPVKVNLPW